MRFVKPGWNYGGKIIDIHCHVLPGVDDGASSYEQSINMLKASLREGTTVLAATPHLVCDGSERAHRAQIQEVYKKVKALAWQNDLPVTMVLGYELLLSPELPHIRNIQDYVIEGTNRILVEPHLAEPPADLDELVYELDHSGVGLILAHPERNEWLAGNIPYLRELAARSVLIQVDAGSIIGQFGRGASRAARKLAGEGLIHLIGSDAHSDSDRGACVREALFQLSGWIGNDEVEAIACRRGERLFQQQSAAVANAIVH